MGGGGSSTLSLFSKASELRYDVQSTLVMPSTHHAPSKLFIFQFQCNPYQAIVCTAAYQSYTETEKG